ncbi:MAG: hypothetical protein KDB00_13730 [Planctomycetales bacterium]|nr:hypothetical protein [Planctomycetales bacterium]
MIASLICEAAWKVIKSPETDPCAASRAERLRREEIQRLEFVPQNLITAVIPARESRSCCYLGEPANGSDETDAMKCLHPDHDLATEQRCRRCRDWAIAAINKRLRLAEMVPPPTQRSGRHVKRWAVGVTTSPRRESTLQSCLESLVRSGWTEPRLFVDAGAMVPESLRSYVDTWRAKRIGAWPNFLLGLTELVLRFPDSDAFMMVQDDAYFYDSENMREYLEQILWPTDSPGIVSLYSTDANSARFRGWHSDPYRWLNGGLAFIFSREVVDRFLSDPQVRDYRRTDTLGGTVNLDLLIGNWAEQCDVPISYPFPSLVQHVGNTSTIWTGEDSSDMRRARCFAGDLETPFCEGDDLACFPEHEFLVADDRDGEYQQSVLRGKRQMQNSTVVITGLCRDVRIWLPRIAARIERLGTMFADYRVVLFENDSKDRTLEFLQDWHAVNNRVHVISRRMDRKRFPQDRCLERATCLAEYRNVCRDYIVRELGDMDYVAVVDTDLPGGWSYEGIATSFAAPEWDAVGSNGILRTVIPSRPPKNVWRHFDSWAFRAIGRSTGDENSDAGELVFHRGDSLVPVWSCFGGLAVYRMECFQAARYGGSDCEHVCFHRELRDQGFDGLYLNPSQIVVY